MGYYNIRIIKQKSDAIGDRCPRKTRPESHQYNFMAGFQAPFLQHFMNANRDGGTGHVSVFMDVNEDFFFGKIQAPASSLDDPDVGLMGKQKVDILLFEACPIHRFFSGLPHFFYSVLENLVPLHRKILEVQVDILLPGWNPSSTTRHDQELCQ